MHTHIYEEKWYTIHSAFGEWYLSGPFDTKRQADYDRGDYTEPLRRICAGHYETSRTIVCKGSHLAYMGYTS